MRKEQLAMIARMKLFSLSLHFGINQTPLHPSFSSSSALAFGD
jgi:hypothetical protein